MEIKYADGFKISLVDVFFMDIAEKSKMSMAFYATENGVVIRQNDIPSEVREKNRKILIGGLKLSQGDDDVLYEVPWFVDNFSEDGRTMFTILEKSDLSRTHVMTLIEKL